MNRHGPEADRHLLRCLFSHVDFSGDGKSSGKDFHQVFWNLYSKCTLTFYFSIVCSKTQRQIGDRKLLLGRLNVFPLALWLVILPCLLKLEMRPVDENRDEAFFTHSRERGDHVFWIQSLWCDFQSGHELSYS